MSAIIRVKRRFDADPAEGLIIQYKRRKTDSIAEDEPRKFCLSLVTTVESKDVTVSRQLHKVLRKEQLQTNYKAHTSKRVHQSQAEKNAKARVCRYRIVNSRRALAYDSLSDSEAEQTAADVDRAAAESKDGLDTKVKAVQITSLDREPGPEPEAVISNQSNPLNSHSNVAVSSSITLDSNVQTIQVVDVEQDDMDGSVRDSSHQLSSEHSSALSEITLNGARLVSQSVPASVEDGYVYDLYYINNNVQHYDFRDLENILSIEAQHDELVYENDRQEECDEVYEDEDDSNDEGNWRNDYPDEDPDRSDDDRDEFELLHIERPASCHYSDDDDFLADAMGTRLKLFGDFSSSSDDEYENENYSERQRGHSAYYKSSMQKDLDEENSD